MEVLVLIGGLANIVIVLIICGFGFNNVRKYRECGGKRVINTFSIPGLILMFVLSILANIYYTVYNVPVTGSTADLWIKCLSDSLVIPIFFTVTAAVHFIFGYNPIKNNLTAFSKFADDGYVVGMLMIMSTPAAIAVLTALEI